MAGKFVLSRKIAVVIASLAFAIFFTLVGGVVGYLLISPFSSHYTPGELQTIDFPDETLPLRGEPTPAPLLGDLGLTLDMFRERFNAQLKETFYKSDQIGEITVLPMSGKKEFRYTFFSQLLLMGQMTDQNRIQRIGLYADPFFLGNEKPLAELVVNAVIGAVLPDLRSEDITALSGSFKPSTSWVSGTRTLSGVSFRWEKLIGTSFIFTVSSP
jgi:hypothetical protein